MKTTELVSDGGQIIQNHSKSLGSGQFRQALTLSLSSTVYMVITQMIRGSLRVPGNSQMAFSLEIHQDQQEKQGGSKEAFPKGVEKSREGGCGGRQEASIFYAAENTGL